MNVVSASYCPECGEVLEPLGEDRMWCPECGWGYGDHEQKSRVTVSALFAVLNGCRFDLTDEKRLQGEIANRFTQQGIPFKREYRLSAPDIPDFLVDGGIVVECKLRGQPKRAIYRQLSRYAASSEVTAVLLVTNVSMGLPPEIGGKPAYFFSLGKGWL